MYNSIKLSMVFIGIVIGAGFASGQEFMGFFLRYGAISIYGVILASVLFGIIAICILNKIYITGARNISEYFGNSRLFVFVDVISTLFMLASYIVMTSGSGAIFEEYLGLPKFVGILSMTVICGIVFWRGADGLVKVNLALTPIMVFGTIFVGMRILSQDVAVMACADGVLNNWVSSALVYVSYNVLTATAVMTALRELITSRKVAILSGIISGISLGVAAVILWKVLYINYDSVQDSAVPMLAASGKYRMFYLPLLYFAIVTTAVSSGFGVVTRLPKKWGVWAVLTCGAIFGFMGFAVLVEKLYGFFGVVGIIIMFYIIFDGVKMLTTKKKRDTI